MEKKYLSLSIETQHYIEVALADGKLSEQEIDLIKRRGAEYGDDPVEIEMVLSAILIELNKEKNKGDFEFIEIKPKYGLVDSYLQALKKYSKFNDRASRSEFWNFIVFNFIIFFTLFTIIGIQGEDFGKNENNLFLFGLFVLLYPLFVITPFICLCIRRLHDLNLSGWFALIPFYNIYLFSKKGYIGDNIYGEDPYKKIIKKITKSNESFIERFSGSKIETVGATMFGIGATSHEAIELKIINYHQLDHFNKWLWIIGGLLIIIPKTIRFLFRKSKSEST
jgi:uncharacterized membrane protein YhaH (DUF805 family)